MKKTLQSSCVSGATESRRMAAQDHQSNSNHQASPQRARTLAIDVGGTGLKASILDARGRMIVDRVRVDTPYPCPPKVMVRALVALVKPLPVFDRVSVGFPGYRHGKVINAPEFGDDIWHGSRLGESAQSEIRQAGSSAQRRRYAGIRCD